MVLIPGLVDLAISWISFASSAVHIEATNLEDVSWVQERGEEGEGGNWAKRWMV